MEIQPTTSLFRGKDVFKVGDICIKADIGTASVEKNKDGSIIVTGGENVSVKNGSQFDLDYETTNRGEGTKITFLDSDISSVIATQGKSRIHFDNCIFHDSGEKRSCFGLLKTGKKSEVIIGGENNEVKIDGDLKGYFSCYSMGDNNAARRDNVVINGNNYAEIAMGIHDEIAITGTDNNEKARKRINDRTIQDILFDRKYKFCKSMSFAPANNYNFNLLVK